MHLPAQKRIIRIKTVCSYTSLSRSYIYLLTKQQKFPKPISLVPGGTSVAWVEQEVIAWVEQRIAERDGGASNE